MTLPYPDSPDVDENIATSIERVKDNLEYLDGSATALISSKTVLSTGINMATRSGAVAVSGVGFQPSAVIIYCCDRSANSASWGFATSATSMSCMYQDYISDIHTSATEILHLDQDVGKSQGAVLTSYGVDGATFTWTKTGLPVGSDMDVIYIFIK